MSETLRSKGPHVDPIKKARTGTRTNLGTAVAREDLPRLPSDNIAGTAEAVVSCPQLNWLPAQGAKQVAMTYAVSNRQ